MIRTTCDVLFPDELEKAYVDSPHRYAPRVGVPPLDQQDFTLSLVGDGYVVTGFLPVDLRTKLTTFDNMVGLCSSCHRLVHTPRLTIDPATHAVTRPSGITYRQNLTNTYLRERAIDRRLRSLFHRAV